MRFRTLDARSEVLSSPNGDAVACSYLNIIALDVVP